MTAVDDTQTHPVARRLQDAGITRAAVIDDAYNDPNLEDLRVEIGDFWAAIDRDVVALSELHAMNPDIKIQEDIDEALIDSLWARALADEQSSLLGLCRSLLFSRQLERRLELVGLVDNLSRLGVTPIPLGTEDDLPDEELKLFFLDFFLGPDPTPPSSAAVEEAIQQLVEDALENQSIQASISKAREILERSDDAFIVLMSSKEGVQRARDKFREVTGLIEGMFDYASKDQLANEMNLYLLLGISAAGLPVRHDIQRFVNSLEKSIDKASEEFVRRIKSLSFEDYLYIYALSLRTEGHPLGDYMLWLYRSLLGHLLIDREQVIDARNKLDSIDLQEFVPLKRAPSTSLADMYRLSLTEPAPWADGQHLQLGDLYVRGTQNALLVINADCDLVHSSQSPSRQFRPDMSILLLPGRLTSVDESLNQGFKVTQLFGMDGQAYKIVWHHERLITKKYGEVVKWLTCEGFVKKARLTAAHALEIQHHFAASLTRVGLPVAPPFPRSATVEVYAKNEDSTPAKLGADIPGGVVLDGGRFRFTVEGFRAILENAGQGIGHYTALRDTYDNSNRRYSRLSRNIERLEEWLQNSAEWFALIESSCTIPGENGSQLGQSGIVQIFCSPNLGKVDTVIAINLLPDQQIIGSD